MSAILSLKSLSFLLCLSSHALAQTENIFLSRPELKAPVLQVSAYNSSAIAPGYLFATPFTTSQPGPYIYDINGDLIWSGFGVAGPANAHDFKVCDYKGSSGDHLSYASVNQGNGFGQGVGIIMDSQFRVVDTVKSGLGRGPADMHEFNVLPGGRTAILIIYQVVPYDLSTYGVASSFGWVTAGIFQEIDIESGRVLFEWVSTDHVDPAESFIKPNTTPVSGSGKSKDSPWDYFHMNSVDKSATGDYLVSARHTSTIYKISGADGSILWRLGGANTSITLSAGFNFSSQHDARFRSEDSTSTTLSFFDNASDGFTFTAASSIGYVVKVDNTTNTAIVSSSYTSGDLRASSQGSTQILPNGNALVGYGAIPTVREYSPDGSSLLYAASLANSSTQSYRWRKFTFTPQRPADSPALFSYAQSSTAPTAFYVSWNGAGPETVATWTFWTGSDRNAAGGFGALATVDRKGFETAFVGSDDAGFQAYAFVEARDREGKSLANSSVVKTFVPGAGLGAACGRLACPLVF